MSRDAHHALVFYIRSQQFVLAMAHAYPLILVIAQVDILMRHAILQYVMVCQVLQHVAHMVLAYRQIHV